jgi:hypothetical protein
MSSIKPNFFTEFASLGEEEKTKGEEYQAEIAFVAKQGGWSHIKKYIESMVIELDATVLAAMQAGASFEEIGRRTAVKEVAKDVLSRVLQYVESARESSDRDA